LKKSNQKTLLEMGLCRLFSEARPQNLAFSLILAAFLRKSGAKNFTSIGFARVFCAEKPQNLCLPYFITRAPRGAAAWCRRLLFYYYTFLIAISQIRKLRQKPEFSYLYCL